MSAENESLVSELDEDEDVDAPSARILKLQLNTLNERKAKLELRISQLQARMDKIQT